MQTVSAYGVKSPNRLAVSEGSQPTVANFDFVLVKLKWHLTLCSLQYLLEGLHVLIWAVGNYLFWRWNGFLFREWLDVTCCTGNNRRQRLRTIWRVEENIADKSDKLVFRLHDVRGVRLHRMAICCLHIQSYLLSSIQTSRQINSVERLTPENFTKLANQ